MPISDSYPIFEPNQVLNHNHLNSLRNYLDEQSRLTRYKLIGIGVLCGFDLSVGAGNQLTVSRGCGVTSMGFLACLEEAVTYTHFKGYEEPAGYEPFSAISDIKVLLKESESGATALSAQPGFFNDKVIVAFVEFEDNKIDSCLAQDCNEQGTWRDFDLQILAIDKADAVTLLKNATPELSGLGSTPTDTEVFNALYPEYLLDDVPLKRISCFLEEGKLPDTFTKLALNYVSSMNESIPKIQKAIKKSYDTFTPLLSGQATEQEVRAVNKKIKLFADYIEKITKSNAPVPVTVQYYYSFVKDIIAAYNEFVELAFDVMAECCPDETSFRRHLFLGMAKEVPGCMPSVFRHYFKQPPIYNNNLLRLQETVRAFQKILKMVTDTPLLDILEKGTWLKEEKKEPGFLLDELRKDKEIKKDAIRITPSSGLSAPTSKRSIPYYYNVSTAKNSLLYFWNFEKYRKCKSIQNLSYHASDYNTKDDFVVNPLCYTIDTYPFFRIEGHLGMDAKDAFEEIKKIRKVCNLPFEVLLSHEGNKALYSEKGDNCYEDLQVNYSIWRNKLLQYLNNVISLVDSIRKKLNSDSVAGVKIVRDDTLNALSKDMLKRAMRKTTVAPTGASVKESDVAMETAVKAAYEAGFFSDEKNSTEFVKSIKKYSAAMENRATMRAYVNKEKYGSAGGSVLSGNDFAGTDSVVTDSRATEDSSAEYRSRAEEFIDDSLKGLLECLRGLYQAMVLDLKDFDYDEFHDNYHCCLFSLIKLMKFAADEAKLDEDGNYKSTLLEVLCWIHRCLVAIAIRPYIAIRVLLDSIEAREARTADSNNLFELYASKPGMEHTGGVPKGGTFILIYGDNGQGEGKIIGDFSIPYMGCYGENECNIVAKPLAPLLVPRCMIVEPEENDSGKENEEITYSVAKIQLLNAMYDPTVYIPYTVSEPKYGTAEFEETVYAPDPAKNNQILTYTVNVDEIRNIIRREPTKAIVIDEFKYGFKNAKSGESNGESTLTVFIVLHGEAEQPSQDDKGTVSGQVYDENLKPGERIAISGAIVTDATGRTATTDTTGTYKIENVPVGSVILTASAGGYSAQEQTVTVTVDGPNTADFSMVKEIPAEVTVNGNVRSVSASGKATPLGGATVRAVGTHYQGGTSEYGTYSFKVPTGRDYTFLCEHRDHISQQTEVYPDLSNSIGINFNLNRKIAFGEIPKYDELIVFIEDDPIVSPNTVVEEMEREMIRYRETIDEVKVDPEIDPNAPIYGAAEVVEEFGGKERINIRRINNEYVKARDNLYESIKTSTGKNLDLQITAYKALTMAYVNRVVLEQPKEFSSTTKKALQVTGMQTESVSGLSMKSDIGEWSDTMNETLPDSIIANVRGGFLR